MRVAYLCADPGVPVFGYKGCSVHVQEVLRAWINQGATVELFAARAGDSCPKFLENVNFHAIPVASSANVAERESQLQAANKPLREALSAAGPFDLIYERHALWSYAGMEWARDQRVPGILEVNAPLVDEQAKYRRLLDREGAEQATYRAMDAAGAAIGVSRQVADYIVKYRGRSSGVHVIPNGVNPERIRSDCEPVQIDSPGVLTIGFVGTLRPWHGVEELIEAFAIVFRDNSNARLLLVGDGPQREQLEAQASRLPLATSRAIQFVGAVKPAEIPAWLASMDVAVAPYAPLEEFYFSPLKLFEYMAAGLPTVASDVGQIAEVLDDRVTGLLYPPGDCHALAKALNQMIRNPEHREQMARAARIEVVRQYTWDAVISRVMNISQEIKQNLPATRRVDPKHEFTKPGVPAFMLTSNP